MKLTYPASVVSGKIEMAKQTRIKMQRETAQAFGERDIIITIEKKAKKRSNNLNRYYWGGSYSDIDTMPEKF